MAPGSSPHKAEEIPKVSFRVIDPQEDALATGLTLKVKMDASTGIYRHYGFNPLGQDFTRDEHYIRYIEPIESELAHQVEYDMDEQDREWLDIVNEERKSHQLDRVSYELFEIIVDKLEKEWFNLAKRIPSAAGDVPTEDSKCSICDDAEGENSNAIVFCDGCNLAVHQDCYGVPYIPEGQWLCRKCTVEPENPVDCIFCPAEAGAFKQTTEAQWAHLLCAIWIPEVGVSNPVYMEPVEGVDGIPKSRWRLVCSICRIKTGACVQCENKNCFTAFHVTCARSQGLLGSMKGANHDGNLRAHCFRHLSADRQAELIEEGLASEDMLLAEAPSRASPAVDRKRGRKINGFSAAKAPEPPMKPIGIVKQAKAARAHAKTYNDGPPLVPAVIVKTLLDYTTKGKVRKPREIVERICRYWSLKREARRGAPLLKRLYLEPWTTSNASKEQTDADKAKKLEYLMLVRNDLERVRMLAELVKKREAEKYRQAQILKTFVDDLLFPVDGQLRIAFDKIVALDRQNLFLEPVNRNDVPDYYNIIRRPMSWSVIDDKLATHRYAEVADIQADIFLALDNAMTYNPPDNPYHKLAARIRKVAADVFDGMKVSLAGSFGPPREGISDLEPSDELMLALEADEPHARDPVTALFAVEFAALVQKELPPPPPPPRKTPAERRAIRDAQLALQIAQGTLSVRSTRASGLMEEPVVVAPATPRTVRIPAKRDRRRADSVVPSPATSAFSDTVVPLTRPQTGVAGIASYSPLDLQERLKRERQLGLTVDHVDEKDHFKRFNVGWVLPEGMKRGGRAAWHETPPVEVMPKSRKGKAMMDRTIMTEQSRSASAVPGPSNGSASGSRAVTPPKEIEGLASDPLSPLSSLSSLSELDFATPTKSKPNVPIVGSSVLDDVSITSSAREAEAAADASESAELVARRSRRQIRGTGTSSQPAQAGPSTTSAREAETIAVPDAAPEIGEPPRETSSAGSVLSDIPDGSRRSPRARQKRKLSDEHWEPQSPRKKAKVVKYGSGKRGKPMADQAEEEAEVMGKRGEDTSGSAGGGASTARPKARKRKIAADPSVGGPDLPDDTALEDGITSPPPSADGAGDGDEVYVARISSLAGVNGTGGQMADEGDDPFPEGTLVWAKMLGYPYFPASIVDVPEEYENISDEVWSLKPVTKPGGPGVEEKVWLVRFYDKTRSFGWCAAGRMESLGEDDEVDKMYLLGRDRKSAKSSFKGHGIGKNVREAYEAARAEIAIEGDEGYQARV